MKIALLPDRGVVRVTGDTARTFLNNLVTSDIADVTPGTPRYAALLTPQGKIIVDFIVVEAPAEDGGGFFLDCPRALVATLIGKLTLYRLRAKVTIEDVSARIAVAAVWGGTLESADALVYPDPRLPALGQRALVDAADAGEALKRTGAEVVDEAAYEAHRIGLTVPRGGFDFSYNDAFPHEAVMDQLAGVDFDKGCFIGQEVVSRMQHRGIARTRIMAATFEDFAPECGLPVLAGDKPAGAMGSSVRGRGIALVRLDRVADANAAGVPVTAGGIALTVTRPAWARFDFPPAATTGE